MRSPYRHSVWFDIFGVLLFGTVLIGGASYLLFHAGGAAGGFQTKASAGGGATVQTPRRGNRSSPLRPPGGRQSSRSGPNSLLSHRVEPSPSGVEAPFSESWQEQATPSLNGSPSPSGRTATGGASGPVSSSSGPAIASSRPPGGTTDRAVQGGGANRNKGTDWRTNARRLSGQVRALSRQLGQMTKESSQGDQQASSTEPPSQASSGDRTTANAGSPPGTPSDPDPVPIDDHVYWLAMAGLLWGIWRLS